MSLYAQALRELGRLLGGRRRAGRSSSARRLGRSAWRRASPPACRSSTTAASTSAPRSPRTTSRSPASRGSTTSTASRSSPTTSSPTSCAATASCVYDDALAAHIDSGAAARRGPRGARDPRLRRPRLRAARPAHRRPAARARRLAVEPRPGARVQGAPAPPHADGLLLSQSSRRRGWARGPGRSGRTSPLACCSTPLISATRLLQRADADGQALDRVGDRVGQVDPVGVRALGPLAVDAHRVAGVADDGRVRRDVVDDDGVGADLRAVADRDRPEELRARSRSSRCPAPSGGACRWRSPCRRASRPGRASRPRRSRRSRR